MRSPGLLLFALLLPGSSLRAEDATPDPQLAKIVSQYARLRKQSQLAKTAAYADQLRALRTSLQQSGDAAGAAKVTEELQAVLKSLALTAPDGSAPAANADDFNRLFDQVNDVEEAESAPMPADGRVVRKVLRLRDAESFSPRDYSREHWKNPGAQLTWILRQIPPGKYRVRLTYSAAAGESGGQGLLKLSGNSEGVSFQIPSGSGTWKDVEHKDIARIEIKELPLSISVETVALAEGAKTLFDLRGILLMSEQATSTATSAGKTTEAPK